MSTEQQSQQTQTGSEFEREPVPKSALLGFKSFFGMYAGEHCAGTELMIGPLFVAAVTPDLVERGYNAGEILKQVAEVAGGGGGGKASFAQAGGKYRDKLDEALRLVKSLI